MMSRSTAIDRKNSRISARLALCFAVLLTACSQKEDQPRIATQRQAATVDFDQSYVVLGKKSVLVENHAHIASGNVGVSFDRSRYPGANASCIHGSLPLLDFDDCFAGTWGTALQVQDHASAEPNTKLVADTIQLGSHVDVSQVYYRGGFTMGSQSQVDSTAVLGAAAFPLFPDLPTPPNALPGGDAEGTSAATVVIAHNTSRCFGPGTYGSFRIEQNASLRFAANCSNLTDLTPATFIVRDIDAQNGAVLRVGPGTFRMRDLDVPNKAEMRFDGTDTHFRDLHVESGGLMVLGRGSHHFRNFRVRAQGEVQLVDPGTDVVKIIAQNRFKLGAQADFNVQAYGASSGTSVDASRVIIYALGTDGPSDRDDEWMPVFLLETPHQPYAVRISSHAFVRANIMAISQSADTSASIKFESNAVGIGSFFADHVLVGDHVELSLRNGLVGPQSVDPSYLTGDIDNDGLLDATDNCTSTPNYDQADSDHDLVGNACDNCPSVANPKQERAYPNNPSNTTGAACTSPPLPYCGDGIVQASNGEACDDGFTHNGPTAPCSLYCVSNLPRILAPPSNVTVLTGQEATFSVSASGQSLSYQWQKNGVNIAGATSSAYTTPAATLADDGAHYRCLVSNFAGTVTSAEAILTVQSAAPVIVTQPVSQAVVEGASVTFSVVAQGSSLSYRWQRNGSNISGATNASLTLSNVQLSDDGAVFQVFVSNGAGSTASAPATLHVTPAPPQITAQPASTTALEFDQGFSFAVVATGQSLSYAWQKDGVAISGATSATYNKAAAALSDAGTYRVTVSNSAGSLVSQAATLTVQLAAPKVLVQPADTTVPEGTTATFTAQVRGSNLSYQWQRNGANIGGATSATLTRTNVPLADDGASFRVVASNAVGSITSSAAVLHVSSRAPIITAQPADVTIDEGTGYQFSVGATGESLSYLWQASNGKVLPNPTSASLTVPSSVLADNGVQFWCVVSNPWGSVTTRLVTLTVHQLPPVITAQPANVTATEGQSATFQVTATGSGLSYRWQRNGSDIAGATAASYTLAPVSATDHLAQFRVIVSNGAGSVTSSAATLQVNLLPPSITVQPASQTVTEGQSVSFAVQASGSQLSYKWRKNGVDIAGATSASFTFGPTTAADNGSVFSVVVSNSAGSVTSQNATLSVHLAAPVIITQPANVTVDEGSSATFAVSAQGTALSYQWQRNGSNIAGATSATLNLSTVSLADDQSAYRCVVANSAASVTSQAAVLTVRQRPPVIVSQPSNQTVVERQSVTFSVSAQGSNLSYRWLREGVAVVGGTGPSLIISSADYADNGANYRVVVENPAGSVTSNDALLTVQLAPPVILAQPADLTVDEGASASFSASVLATNASYQWLRNGQAIADATATSYALANVTLADDGAQFSLRVTNAAGTVLSTLARLSVRMLAPVIVSQPADARVLEHDNATFSVTASGSQLSYQWQRNGTDLPGETSATLTVSNVALSDAGSAFRVVVSNSAGNFTSLAARLDVDLRAPVITAEPADQSAPEGGSVTFSVLASGSLLQYQWHVNGAVRAGATSPQLTLTALGLSDDGTQVYVVVNNAAGSVTSRHALLHVSQNAPVISSQPSAAAVDEGQIFQFSVTALGTGLSYQWRKNGLNIPGATSATYAGTAQFADDGSSYSVSVSNAAGSVTSNSALLTVHLKAPVLIAEPDDQSVIEGGSVTFSAGAQGTLLSYQWQRDGVNIPGANAPSYVLTQAALTDDGARFACVISNAAGSVTTRAARLSVLLAAPVIVAQPASLTVDEGDPASFAVSAHGSQLSYQWQRNGADITGEASPVYSIAQTPFAYDGSLIRVVVRNGAGTVVSAAASLTVRQRAPVITSAPQDTTVLVGGTASFTCQGQGSLLSYQWQRNDVPIPGEVMPTLTVSGLTLADDGASYRCQVSNAAGSVTSAAAVLRVVECIVASFVPHATSCGVGACAAHGVTACVAGRITDSCTAGAPASSDASCNGVDDDCNGTVDDGYASTSTSCGVGSCSRSGSTSCVDGHVVDDCQAGTPAANDTSCNGVDDDCNGAVDEDYVVSSSSCGVGACGAHGTVSCTQGHEVDSCQAGTPAADDASCDGIDSDCSGDVDEDFASTVTHCGVGACGSTGSTSCVAGSLVDSCHAGVPGHDDATCNGSDDDCDGSTDEDYLARATSCGVGACSASGTTSCQSGQETDSCHAGTPASGDASCDGVDDDCDGLSDEDYAPVATSCGTGECHQTGNTACLSGHVVDDCRAGDPAATDADCNGRDDDCDGHTDEEYTEATTQCGVGACHATGTRSCQSGSEVDSCRPFEAASDDATCNGTDDDCDGQIDEDYQPTSTSCGVGACGGSGMLVCTAGHVLDTCHAGQPSLNDQSCNGTDDDCDGEVDEDYQPHATACGVGSCAAHGATRCQSGQVLDSCLPEAPAEHDASCDGQDDDCDGQIDEDYLPQATSCGIGACHNTGLKTCSAGGVSDSCMPAAPALDDSSCNGVDDDCDGQIDEDYVALATHCGVGACAAGGSTSCVAGSVHDSCNAGSPATADSTCDGIDDDCNGLADDGYVARQTSCGIGACAAEGVTSCAGGSEHDSCHASTPANQDATCNGIDDDCDGSYDEDYAPLHTSCGLGVCAATGATSCVNGQTIDSCVEGQAAGSDTSCNGLDDDCDGQVDEDFVSVATSCGVGACAAGGETSCVQGHVNDSCTPGHGAATDASCDGIDNDCNGQTDEDYQPLTTSCGVGACSASGSTSCSAGSVVDSCTPGAAAASDTSCDDRDDDCDGEKDEDFVSNNVSCGVGACASHGSTACEHGTITNKCQPGQPAASDASCNALDDDCDGTVDEDYTLVATSCGAGACSRTGVTSCGGGHVSDSCEPGAPATGDASCDGVDDDCDGQLDEDYAPHATSCGVGTCTRSGATSCLSGHVLDDCQPAEPASDDASCNGLDDDCNGEVDEDYASLSTSCGVGACGNSGTTSCESGQVLNDCHPHEPALDDTTCNGVDDDCDGLVDEDYVPVATSCGVGTCAGTGLLTCDGGALVNTCHSGTPSLNDQSCNGLDDDCDGQIDEDFLSTSTACGVGACAASGVTSCQAGQVHDSCLPEAPAADDRSCNGRDDDCDGQVDEEYAALATHCGVGACGSSGSTSCVNGSVLDSCQPGTPALDDASCNDVDDDCDGSRDEDYFALVTHCGVGACAATGITSCTAGSVQDSCHAGQPSASDSSCDGIDDDCDGARDEDFAPATTQCGVGACASTGTTACADGTVTNSCHPGAPGANDTSCNGVDDDCNGASDDGYIVLSTQCGVGACAATGVTSCQNGQVADSCSPTAPAASDASCDGRDDDCNGAIDEDYVSLATTCGLGECSASGHTACNSGQVVDSCNPGTPAATDASCNGRDDDCNGATDDDYVAVQTSCGVGACAHQGLAQCSHGQVVDDCTPGTPAASDDNCDGSDDNCNGQTDEGYIGNATSCGVGVCAASGTSQCLHGSVVSGCNPGTPAASDQSCDDRDDDCDGSKDEDFQRTCAGSSVVDCVSHALAYTNCDDADACTGAESCSSGSCVAGTPPTVDDQNSCTTDACNPSSGVSHTPLARGTDCGASSQCDQSGLCVLIQPPHIVTPPHDLTVSVGASATFSVLASGGNLTYQWLRMGQPIAGATDSSYTLSNVHMYDQDAEFSVQISNSSGSAMSAPAGLSVLDDVDPVLVVDGGSSRSVNTDTIRITGRITDSGSGVARVLVTSARYGGQAFAAVVDANGFFSAEVPLKLGSNTLSVRGDDLANNSSTRIVTVTYAASNIPSLAITSPGSGLHTTDESVTIVGTVRSSLPADQLRVSCADQLFFPQGSGDEYAFSFANVALLKGANNLVVRASSPYGEVVAQALVYRDVPEQTTPHTPPRLRVYASSTEVYVPGESVDVKGSAEADQCFKYITVNGAPASVMGQGKSVTFSASVAFAASETRKAIEVVAVDCSDASSTVDFTAVHDLTDPVLSVDNAALAPAVNPVDSTPYTLSGQIQELNLAGFSVDDQSVGVLPQGDAGNYAFSLSVPLVRGQLRSVSLDAWDFAGHHSKKTVQLQLSSTLDLEIVTPADGERIVSDANPAAVDVAVRAVGAATTDRILASIDGATPTLLTLTGALARGSVPVPRGKHTLLIRAESESGTLLASKTQGIEVIDEDDITLTLVSSEPAQSATGVEPNVVPAFVFSKRLADPTKLSVQAYETVHGLTYSTPAFATDPSTQTALTRVAVDREHVLSSGTLLVSADGKSALFQPHNEPAYGARIDFDVFYDGQRIGQLSYAIRPNPTLFLGSVLDQTGTRAPNLEVSIKELGYTATTDNEGTFTFGFGEPAERNIPGGRYRLIINANSKDPRYGTLERLTHFEEGALSSFVAVHIPVLHDAIPYVHITSGQSASFDNGRFSVDVSNATLGFPGGLADGDVHVQPLLPSDISYQTDNLAAAEWFYSFTPHDISVTGDVTVSMPLRARFGSFDFVDRYSERVLFVGLDLNHTAIVVVGAGRLDANTQRVTSQKLELTTLNMIGYQFLPRGKEVLIDRYLEGNLTLKNLVSALSGGQ